MTIFESVLSGCAISLILLGYIWLCLWFVVKHRGYTLRIADNVARQNNYRKPFYERKE